MHRIWGPVQFWAALTAGRTIALLGNADAASTLAFIRKRRITHWSALPESFRQMRELGTEAVRKADTSSLRELEIGGAPATQDLKAWVADLFAPILSEAYGSTGTGRISTISFTRKIEKPGSCGRPADGVTVEIRDGAGQTLLAGEVGEIWARTPRTIESELAPEAQRMFRDQSGFVATGDTGRVDEDGYIYLTDRTEAARADYILRAG
jgi:long-chain acyl-CoA synthetase